MKISFLKLTAFVLGLVSIGAVQAQNVSPVNIVTTAVPFLRISPDARAGGMGELGVATSPDANSAFYNLAKTPFAEYKTGIGITYSPWLSVLTVRANPVPTCVTVTAADGTTPPDESMTVPRRVANPCANADPPMANNPDTNRTPATWTHLRIMDVSAPLGPDYSAPEFVRAGLRPASPERGNRRGPAYGG